MARPKIYDEPRVTTAIRLPESVHDRLRAAADERDISANLIATKAIEQYLDHLKPLESNLGRRVAGQRSR
jgi:predicted transcriptional regulator